MARKITGVENGIKRKLENFKGDLKLRIALAVTTKVWDGSAAVELWRQMDAETQKSCAKLLPKILDNANYPSLKIEAIESTYNDEVKDMNADAISEVKSYIESFEDTEFGSYNDERKRTDYARLYAAMSPSLRNQNRELADVAIFPHDLEFFNNADLALLQDPKVERVLLGQSLNLWEEYSKEIQRNFLEKAINYNGKLDNGPANVAKIFRMTNKEIQEEKSNLLPIILNSYKDDFNKKQEFIKNLLFNEEKIDDPRFHGGRIERKITDEFNFRILFDNVEHIDQILPYADYNVIKAVSETLTEEERQDVINGKYRILNANNWSAVKNERKDLIKSYPQILYFFDESVIKSHIGELLDYENEEIVKCIDKDIVTEKVESIYEEKGYISVQAWKIVNEDTQREILNKMIQKSEKDKVQDITRLFAFSKQNTQMDTVDLLYNSFLKDVQTYDGNTINYMLYSSSQTQEYIQDKYPELFKNLFDSALKQYDVSIINDLWGRVDKSVQKNNPEIFKSIVQKIRETQDSPISEYRRFLEKTGIDIRKDNPEIVKEFVDIVKEKGDIDDKKDLWKTIKEDVQQDYPELFQEIYNNILLQSKEKGDDAEYFTKTETEKLFKDTSLEFQKDVFPVILKSYSQEERYNFIRNYINSEAVLGNLEEFSKLMLEKDEIPSEYIEKFKELYERNSQITETINWEFLEHGLEKGYDDEQLLRITRYPEAQEYLLQYKDNQLVNKALEYVFKNDSNWVISLEEKIRKNSDEYKDLIDKVSTNLNLEEVDEEFLQNFLSIISDDKNYFDIQSVEDIRNYKNIKDNLCRDILEGKTDNIPDSLKEYSTKDLYKFALLEYKFGISLEEAKFITERYGQNAEEIYEKMPTREEARYLVALKTIVECDNIEETIQTIQQNKELGKNWGEYPNSRNAEGQIINMFAELYNETFYKPKEEEKSQQEIYVDKEGNEHPIDVYSINGDFNMNVRIEGAYRQFIEPDNFKQYYNKPDIANHGNCESYIGNDLIATARYTKGVMVGYSEIKKNCLTVAGPADLGTSNENMSLYREKDVIKEIRFLLPKIMINLTRHPHNEMVEDRIYKDKDGNLKRHEPNYAVWIEESTKEERDEPGWKEKRESDEKWIRTKKLAAQLGIPIVVIDRERFAEREMQKIELMQQVLNGDIIDKEKYAEYLGKDLDNYISELRKMSKQELIKQMITKFENNSVGIQFNEKLSKKYFTNDQLDEMIRNITISINKGLPSYSNDKEKIKLFNVLARTLRKEENRMEISNYELDKENEVYNRKRQRKIYYKEGQEICKSIIDEIQKRRKKILRKNPQMVRPSLDTKGAFESLLQKISSTDYYEGNKQHSIEHIQKVMLFSQALAEGEGLSEQDTKLLLVAAAFHDSGRKGLREEGTLNTEQTAKKISEQDAVEIMIKGLIRDNERKESGEGDIPHAEPSAIKAGEILSKKNEFGEFSKEEIAMIQTAIHYHEYKEKEKGKIDFDAIKGLAINYGVDFENINDMNRTVQLCTLLKDADALDRCRFAEQGKLDPEYLHSNTAKKRNIIEYAEKINREVASRILRKNYNMDIDYDNMTSVFALYNTRKYNEEHNIVVEEEHIKPEEFKSIYENVMLIESEEQKKKGLEEVIKPESPKTKRGIFGKIKQFFKAKDLTKEDIQKEEEMLVADVKRSKEQTKEQETQNNDTQGFDIGDNN